MSARQRDRLLTSLLSLALVAMLIGGWCALRGSSEKEGKLGSISTATVQVTIGPTASAAPGASATARARGGGLAALERSGRRPPLLAEVLGEATQPTPAAPSGDEAPGEAAEEEEGAEAAAEEAGEEAEEDATATPEGPEPETTPGAAPPPPGGGGVTDRPPIFNVEGFIGPGSYATGAIKITNSGTGQFNYSVSLKTSGDGAFADFLKLRISLAGSGSCSYPGKPSSGDDFLGSSGTVLYEGNFATGNKVGDPAQATASGDWPLGAGANQVLCLELFYPWGGSNDFQGKSVNGTFVFTAKTPS